MLKRVCFTAGVVLAFGGVLLAPSRAQAALTPDGQVQDAQAPPDDASSTPPPAAVTPAPAASYVPLTLGQKFFFSANKVFSPGAVFLYNFRASYDVVLRKQAPWGGEGAYGLHAASFLGRSFLRQNLAFGVRALDHEDPRYFALGSGSTWTRIKYAAVRTFVARNDYGGTIPAYSLFVAAYATPLLADRWGLEHFLNPHPLRAGTAGLGVAVGSDLVQEFWPDIKKKMKLESRLRRFHGH